MTCAPDTTACVDEQLYLERLHRYVTAMRNETPDRVPVRPFMAEFCGKACGFDGMQQSHDFQLSFQAVRNTAQTLDCDAIVGNMVYVWTGLTQAVGLKYYAVPGFDCDADHGFQYLEPSPGNAWMPPEDYDQLIEDPTGYLLSVWLPRVSSEIAAPGRPCTIRNQAALIKGGMAMLQYFAALEGQNAWLRQHAGMPAAISGILKAPLDILADKLRGYFGLAIDLMERPEKVLAACQALAPHLLHVALAGADPERFAPVGFWMHRGCVPLITPRHFADIQWPTLKPIIENIWAAGHQTLFYAEGRWAAHLDAFAELPDRSIVFHVDQDDLFEVHDKLGNKFCLSGGVPNTLLAFGEPDQVDRHCREIIERVAGRGGYILDASAILQADARLENIQAMVRAARLYGDYGSAPVAAVPRTPAAEAAFSAATLEDWHTTRPPGTCIPWHEQQPALPPIRRHAELAQRVWENIDGLAHTFIWHLLVSF